MKKNQVRIAESTQSAIEVELEEVKKLEEEAIKMANKLQTYRSTFPLHFSSSLSSLLSLQRPSSTFQLHCGPYTTDPASEDDNSSTDLYADDGEQSLDDVKLLRDKISNNISAIPKVLKRMNECISRLDKLGPSNGTVHPRFKRQKTFL